MKNKGFTLVELLAVIVILAVLALIATPVVLSIIDDTKESAMLRSAEMYLSGVENAVMRENMNTGGNFRPNDCTISNGTLSCNGTTVEVEVNGEVPKEGTIVFENGKIKEVELIYESGTIVKDDSGNLVYEGDGSSKKIGGICTYLNNGVEEKTAGAKYSCEVSPGVSYNFYVLTTPEDGSASINLIMDRNIYYDENNDTSFGVTTEYLGIVPWQTSGTSIDGPVTAMDYLYNATKDWSNVPNIVMNYTDEGNNYGSIITTNEITKITKKDGTPIIVLNNQEGYLNLKARMPYLSEISSYDANKKNAYLFDNLTVQCFGEDDSNDCDVATEKYGVFEESLTHISGSNGYWILSSSSGDSEYASGVLFDGSAGFQFATIADSIDGAVRPVITLNL